MGKKLDLSKQVRAWQIMLYVEQIGHREELTKDEKEVILKEYLDNIEFKDGLFYGILHNKELNTVLNEDVNFTEEKEEPHLHLVFYTANQIRPSTILRLLGIEILKENENLYTHGGFSYLNIKKHEVAKAILYLNHNTEKAIIDNKPLYEISDIVTNDTEVEWYHKYSEEYSKYSEGLYINRFGQVQQVNEEDKLFDYFDELEKLGFEFGDFYKYIDSIPRRYKYKYYHKLEEVYYRGVHRRLRMNYNLRVNRVAIFIHGGHGVGKTHACEYALQKLNRCFNTITSSSGTGGEDNIIPGQSIIYDDRIPANCLDKADDKVCMTYRRNSNNGVFSGDFFIINHNKSFDSAFSEWWKSKGDPEDELSASCKALKSRFFIIEVSDYGTITVVQVPTRAESEVQKEKIAKFNEFLKYFSEPIKHHADHRIVDMTFEQVDETEEF